MSVFVSRENISVLSNHPSTLPNIFYGLSTFKRFPTCYYVHWKDWSWGWNSITLATSFEELTHWKRLWCWEGLGAGGEEDDRGWHGWVASLTQCTRVGKTPGFGDGQGGLACCDSWGRKESDTTEWLNWTELKAGSKWKVILIRTGFPSEVTKMFWN